MSNRGVQAAEPNTTDRRVSNRLPIEREVRYQVLGGKQAARQTGSGKTLNMSSGGVLFTTESGLPEGAHVELAISWPAKLDDATRLKLVAKGVLIRSADNQAAISIQSYEFKTHGLRL
jgi:c-di-GMP-binding flagellar brake protein YcgR